MQTLARAEEESGSLYGASPGSVESLERAAWLLAHPHSLGNPGFNRERKRRRRRRRRMTPIQNPPTFHPFKGPHLVRSHHSPGPAQ